MWANLYRETGLNSTSLRLLPEMVVSYRPPFKVYSTVIAPGR
jgi:hypothetical protein